MFGGLKDNVALISGAGAAMGRATVIRLAKEGCKIYATDIAQPALDVLMEQAKEAGVADMITTNACDPSVEENVKAAVADCVAKLGNPGILINLQGIYNTNAVEDMPTDQWKGLVDFNLTPMFYFCREVVPMMKAAKKGKIINMASQAGVLGSMNHSHYAASKGAVIGFTRSIARETAAFGINCNCVAPGIVKSRMSGNATPEAQAVFMAKIPMQRFGEPDEAARVFEFLASDGSDYLTGQCYNVTGGWLMNS